MNLQMPFQIYKLACLILLLLLARFRLQSMRMLVGTASVTHAGLQFRPDGTPAHLQIGPEKAEYLDVSHPGPGFYLSVFDGMSVRSMPLNVVYQRNHGFVVTTNFGLPQFTFKVHVGKYYVALHLADIKGRLNHAMALTLKLNTRCNVRAIGLDYMTDARADSGIIRVKWPYLWRRDPLDPLGTVGFYDASSDSKEEQALLDIWGDGYLPHPEVKGSWNVACAQQWMTNYLKRFHDMTDMVVAADKPQELYQLADIARRNGVKLIYIFSTIWRGYFWPDSQSHVHVNRCVFPSGLRDFKKFSDYLHAHNMLLGIHYTSACIGPHEQALLRDDVLQSLAGWGKGTIVNAITPTTRMILFRPAPGTTLPIVGGNLGDFFDDHMIRIGREIVRVGHFADLNRPVWHLEDCQRGFGVTKAVAHSAASQANGLYLAYGHVFVPSPDSPLLNRMATQIAYLVNYIGVDNLVFDGLEIDDSVPWGARKFTALVESDLNHAITTGTSGGKPAWGNTEMRFPLVRVQKQALLGYTDLSLPIELADNQLATSVLAANFSLQQGIAAGSRRFRILKPEPMFGVTLRMLGTLGDTRELLQTFREWKQALHLLTPVQLNLLDRTVLPIHSPLSGNHLQGNAVLVIHRRGAGFEWIPTQVMLRHHGDSPWRVGQEFGVIPPEQYCLPGDVLILNNRYNAQPATFVIRVLPQTQTRGPSSCGHAAITIQPTPGSVQNQLFTGYQQDGNAVELSSDNPTATGRWCERRLPWWPESFSMKPGKALACDVTGDGSGAVLVVQVHGQGERDYVVKINFTGTRHVVIPNGEVAWVNGYWGWRMGAKSFDYGKVSRVSMGFGYVPPYSHPRVKVANLMRLVDVRVALQNPVIHAGGGTLRIHGTIASGQYVKYTGGNRAAVYDKNWNLITHLPVTLHNYVFPHGYAPVHVEAEPGAPHPWLETQFIVEGKPILIGSTE